MKIVIDIPNFTWIEDIKDFKSAVKEYEMGSGFDHVIREALLLGTLLPEHHGRLIDADELEECKEIMTTLWGESKYAIRMDDIRNMPTIIEGSDSK